jgi:hypothetical protein
MNTVELKKMIFAYLKAITPSVYEVEAPAKVSYPYVVYTLQYSTTNINEKREDFNLYIDIYDNDQFNSLIIDALIGSIDGNGAIVSASGLHRKHYYVAGTLQADFYRTSRETVEEDDNIRHMQLQYDVMTYLA